jgi:hypothetical protein
MKSLQQLEAEIKTDIRAYIRVGNALHQIHDRALYKDKFLSFEAYCKERWNLRRSVAYNFMYASQVANNVRSTGQVPSHTQAAAMHPLSPSQQRSLARSTDFSTVTVKDVKHEVWNRLNEKRKNRSEPPASFGALRTLALRMLNLGLAQLRSEGREDPSHLDAAKTWAHGVLSRD